MTICGIKLTHDAAICVIENNKLVFSIEMEKLNNNPRYSIYCISYNETIELLESYNIRFNDIDRFVVDGWANWYETLGFAKRQYLPIDLGNGLKKMQVARYGFLEKTARILDKSTFRLKDLDLDYYSYKHVSGHLIGSYCTSPFAANRENSFLLVWDGALSPQLFYWNVRKNKIDYLGFLMPLVGNIYTHFSTHFEPFKKYRLEINVETGVAGKIMAYIALGEVNQDLFKTFETVYNSHVAGLKRTTSLKIESFTALIIDEFVKAASPFSSKPEDILTTFHSFINDLLIKNLKRAMSRIDKSYTRNLCYSGGCALNIKWNSSIRNSGVFEQMWVPPFPNDAGSALGTACCEMVNESGIIELDWNVYSGPRIKRSVADENWSAIPDFSLKDLAYLLFTLQEPVVFMNGDAELGPRALGARSILAPATNPDMKQRLNAIKDREFYRPVAPICLEEFAPDIFDPGIPDPFMLYDHQVKPSWKQKIPAICHLDGTARLQTINKQENPTVYRLIDEYRMLSKIPLLCNTSANFNGKGFFPDVKSVIEWGRVNFIWCEGSLYYKKEMKEAISRLELMELSA